MPQAMTKGVLKKKSSLPHYPAWAENGEENESQIQKTKLDKCLIELRHTAQIWVTLCHSHSKQKKAPLGATRSAKVNDHLKIVSTENSSNKGKNKVTKKPCGMILNILHSVKKNL